MLLLSICSQTYYILATISDSSDLDKTPCFKPKLRTSTSSPVSSNLVKFVITLFGFFFIPSVILLFTIKASCFFWSRPDVTVFIFDCALLIEYIINLYLIHVVACFNLVLLVSCSAYYGTAKFLYDCQVHLDFVSILNNGFLNPPIPRIPWNRPDLRLYHFYGLFTAYLLYEEAMSVRL